MTSTRTLALAVAALVLGGCGHGPTSPSGARSSSLGTASTSSPTPEPFAVTGIVTDEQGVPVAGAEVTMSHYESGRMSRPAVLTDGGGRYAITFPASPWTQPSGRFAARAEVVADGYDWYWRNVSAADSQRVENFRLVRIKRIAGGDMIAVTVSSENGDCTGWLFNPCGRLRITAPASGDLTIEAIPIDAAAAMPTVEACCLNGNEQGGNPVTMHVNAGSETWVEIGQTTANVNAAATVIVRTSLRPQ
jgi:hypothetical protein